MIDVSHVAYCTVGTLSTWGSFNSHPTSGDESHILHMHLWAI